MRVLRYTLELNDDEQAIALPSGTELLHVACRRGEHCPSLWVRVPGDRNWETPGRARFFRVIGTGHHVTEDRPMHFVGTAHAFTSVGELLWHVFEVERAG